MVWPAMVLVALLGLCVLLWLRAVATFFAEWWIAANNPLNRMKSEREITRIAFSSEHYIRHGHHFSLCAMATALWGSVFAILGDMGLA